MRVGHVIDRRECAQSARHLVLALVSESKSNSRLSQGARGGVHSTVTKREGVGED